MTRYNTLLFRNSSTLLSHNSFCSKLMKVLFVNPKLHAEKYDRYLGWGRKVKEMDRELFIWEYNAAYTCLQNICKMKGIHYTYVEIDHNHIS